MLKFYIIQYIFKKSYVLFLPALNIYDMHIDLYFTMVVATIIPLLSRLCST
jgi:hypothetical protein